MFGFYISPLHDESSPVVGRGCAMFSTSFLALYVVAIVLSLLCFNTCVDIPGSEDNETTRMIRVL